MTNYQSNAHNSESATPVTLDDMLAAVRLLKRPLLCRIETGEGMIGFLSDMICRANPKPLLDDVILGGVPIVDNEWLPAGWARGVDQDGDTLFLMTREHYYDFSKVAKLPLEPSIWRVQMKSLFQHGQFTLHSGQQSDYRIECDAFTPSDWEALAYIIKARIPAFGAVYGVPRGGIPLRDALIPFATGNAEDPLLIVDDVYTSGASMRAAADGLPGDGSVLGVVVFAREVIAEPWVQAVFGMTLETNSRASLYAEVLALRAREAQLLAKIQTVPQRMADEVLSVQQMKDWSNQESGRPEVQVNGCEPPQKFEKCKQALSTLYYDSSYTSRSNWVNEFLDDPEIQGWIREKA